MSPAINNPPNATSAIRQVHDRVQRMLVALQCPACHAPYDRNPVKVHVCGHTLCTKCATDASSNGRAPCCHKPVRPRDLQPDRSVAHLVQAVAALAARATPRIALTALEPNALAAAEHALHTLGVQQAQPRIATHIVTRVHAQEVARRTRAVHYALARDIPIVDVTWLLACAERQQWLPARPYEAARAYAVPHPDCEQSANANPIFHNVVAFVDVPDPLGCEVADWMHLAGATVLKPNAPIPDDVRATSRLVLRIIPDIAHIDVEENHHDCDADVQDVAWVSDCLVSHKCPPAVDYLETMATQSQPLTLAHDFDEQH